MKRMIALAVLGLSMPAHATTMVPYGPYYQDGAVPNYPTRWDFKIIGDLPDGLYIQTPAFNQWWRTVGTWTADGIEYHSIDDYWTVSPHLNATILNSSATSWSILYRWDQNFDVCNSSTPKVGQVCSVEYQAWANASWYPITGYYAAHPEGQEPLVPYSLTITAVPEPSAWLSLISGFALVGCALRRKRANRMFVKLGMTWSHMNSITR